MKKIITIAALVALGTAASYSQGLISISLTTAKISTNTTANVTGVVDGNGAFAFELLYANVGMSASATNISLPSNLALWTDSTVGGVNGFGLNRGKLTAGGSVSASGWVAPGVSYDNARNFIIVGWSTTLGSTWANVVNLINGAGLDSVAGVNFFGTTTLSTGFAGGGSVPLPAVNEWANVASGTLVLQQVVPTPEPGTIALAGLGGLSLLALRRKK